MDIIYFVRILYMLCVSWHHGYSLDIIFFNYHIIIVWDLRAGQFFFEGMDLLVCITESANEAFATSQLVDVCWFARISMK
jgi:hypothetical protein